MALLEKLLEGGFGTEHGAVGGEILAFGHRVDLSLESLDRRALGADDVKGLLGDDDRGAQEIGRVEQQLLIVIGRLAGNGGD
ncbi:hypothetical protein MRS76_18675 [Rhizobiaceae bacterium n13]|uniref:Uncharacterized protein n=1 Tax=Ferirhizobium litorale TaxID=2927786 RepID=A0AAE3QGD2_9HYPH|nr:hypothetical protein [Fererhizobium litorale]MDI7863975.1 hypothetical protein [Fererhizobium litorale]MDI7924541.1 hypothetical protein [Fererhizobium litorale]